MKKILTIASLLGLIGCGSLTIESKNGKITAVATTPAPIATPESSSLPEETDNLEAQNANTNTSSQSAKSFSVTPAGCAGESARFFDNGNGISAFVLATCTDSPQIYGTLFSYEGVAGGASKLLSECTYGVKTFAIDKGPNSYLLSYACANSGDYSVFVKEIAFNLATSSANKIDEIQSAISAQIKHKIAWNPEANKFGYVSVNGFASIDETGTEISPLTKINNSIITISELFVSNGKWHIITNGSVNSNDLIIFNPDIVLESNEALNIHKEGSNSSDSYIALNSSFLLSNSSYAFGYRISSSSGSEPSPLFSQGDVGKPIAGIQIDNRTGYALLAKENALVLAKIKLAGIPSIEFQATIALKDENASIKQIKENILVSHKLNDKVIISYH